MSFLEARISTQVTNSTVFEMVFAGRKKLYDPLGRLQQSFVPAALKYRVNLSHGIKTAADYAGLFDAFVIVLCTPYEGLRVKNHRDYIASASNSRATLVTGSTTVLQLQRLHSFGGTTYLRNITKPSTDAALTVYRTRASVRSAIVASIDYTTGLATISGHVSGDTYDWTGQFDLPMTFEEDKWGARMEVGKDGGLVVPEAIWLEELT